MKEIVDWKDAHGKFTPPVPPETSATASEIGKRKQLLCSANVQQHVKAMQMCEEAYAVFKNQCSEKQRKYVPATAPAKFTADKYYGFLEDIVSSTSTRSAHASKKDGDIVFTTLSRSTHAAQRDVDISLSCDDKPSDTSKVDSSISGVGALLSGNGFVSVMVPASSVEYMSAIEILSATSNNLYCKFQGVLIACEDEAREVQSIQESPRKRKAASENTQAIDILLMDQTGPIKATVWGALANEVCSHWRSISESRRCGQSVKSILDFSKMRVAKVPKNDWNGQVITNMLELVSIEPVGAETGTSMMVLSKPTAANLISMCYAVPSPQCCVSSFQSIRGKLRGNFRLTVKGVISDLEDVQYSQAGNEKRLFDLVDHQGAFINCCAMKHNVASRALVNLQEVVVYFASGRGPRGSAPGLLYLMKDAMIVSIGAPRSEAPAKCVHFDITGGD